MYGDVNADSARGDERRMAILTALDGLLLQGYQQGRAHEEDDLIAALPLDREFPELKQKWRFRKSLPPPELLIPGISESVGKVDT